MSIPNKDEISAEAMSNAAMLRKLLESRHNEPFAVMTIVIRNSPDKSGTDVCFGSTLESEEDVKNILQWTKDGFVARSHHHAGTIQ